MAPEDVNFDRIRTQLTGAVNSVCPHWFRDHREDIVHNALVRIMEIQARGEGKRGFSSSYLWKVAYSALIDEIRRAKIKKIRSMEQSDVAPNMVADDPDPEQASAGREIGAAIQQCMGLLVRSRRLAVSLYLFGYTVPQAAHLLGWGPKKVDNLVYRGLADIRKCLKSKGYGR